LDNFIPHCSLPKTFLTLCVHHKIIIHDDLSKNLTPGGDCAMATNKMPLQILGEVVHEKITAAAFV